MRASPLRLASARLPPSEDSQCLHFPSLSCGSPASKSAEKCVYAMGATWALSVLASRALGPHLPA
eukprot:2497408-Alexandrium_andersonii.AAC.1